MTEGTASNSLVYLAVMSFIGEEVMETAWGVKNFVEQICW